jgi:Zn-dependent M28 family amino/carboxypeptidase
MKWNKCFKLLPILFFMHTQVQAQPAARPFAQLITPQFLQEHLTVIASDSMEGRETGTPGQRRAAAYLVQQFKAMGLQPVQGAYEQLYPLNQDSVSITESSVRIGASTLLYGTDFFVSAINNSSGKFNAAQIVFAGYGISHEKYDDYAGLDVKGKTVVILMGEPRQDGAYVVSGSKKISKFTYPGTSIKMEIAAQKGAAGVIVINPSMEKFSSSLVNNNSKTNVYYPQSSDAKRANYLVISHDAAKRMFTNWPIDTLIQNAKTNKPFASAQVPVMDMPVAFAFKKEKQIIQASNVMGMVEGADKKDEYVFVTAHYDHLGKRGDKIYYGADDDGSGTVGVIAMARAFAQAKAAGKGPRRSVVFMAVSGEEKGLWGSEYYTDNPLLPLNKTSVDLNVDMVGRIDTERKLADTLNYVYVIGHDKLSSELQGINEKANSENTALTLDYKFDDPKDENRIYYRSDHYNFARKGVPVLFFYDGMLKSDYHKPTDTVDKIYWELYQKRVHMIFYTAWAMANRDEMLKRDTPLPDYID